MCSSETLTLSSQTGLACVSERSPALRWHRLVCQKRNKNTLLRGVNDDENPRWANAHRPPATVVWGHPEAGETAQSSQARGALLALLAVPGALVCSRVRHEGSYRLARGHLALGWVLLQILGSQWRSAKGPVGRNAELRR